MNNDLFSGNNYALIGCEYERIIYEWNNTVKEYPNKTIPQLFEDLVLIIPENIALVFEEYSLTFNDVNEKSNQLARHIRSRYYKKAGKELQPDTLIAIMLDRSLEMIIAMLAILKAGGAYVPVDINYPKDRIAYILNDTKADFILIQKELITSGKFFFPENLVIPIDLCEALYEEESVLNLQPFSQSDSLAYVIYTSGTTGRPKGVLIEHKSVVSLVDNDCLELADREVFAFLSSPVFDAATFEIWTPLLKGKKLAIPKDTKALISDISELRRFILQNSVSILWLTKTLCEGVYYADNSIFQSLNYLITGGEALDQNFVGRLLEDNCRPKHFLNGYGPTESTVFATIFDLDQQITTQNVPIGKPISNRTIYLLDNCKKPVSVGVTGELFIGGPGVARGYLNQPELTNECFIPDEFGLEAGKVNGYAKMYKTGDMARWLPDGNLEYLGRNDDQVKLRGYRIELREVECVLSGIEGVRQSCVIVRERSTPTGVNKYLIAYYVCESGISQPASGFLKEKLLQVLPEYMVPNILIALPSFPLTPNGKTDKNALPDPFIHEAGNERDKLSTPANELEEKLARIGATVLGFRTLDCSSDFFEMGGNSLLASMFLARVRSAINLEIPMRLFLQYPVIRELAQVLNAGTLLQSEPVFPVAIAIRRSDDQLYDLSFPQMAIWMLNEIAPVSTAYNAQLSIRFEGNLDIPILQQSINELIKKHESLRTTFHTINGIPGQKIHNSFNFRINTINLTNLDEHNKEKNIAFILSGYCDYKFDISCLPLFKWDVVILDEHTYELIIVEHHFVHDGWSASILLNELGSIYTALSEKNAVALKELDFQMVDFAAWQRNFLRSPFASESIAYWKSKLKGAHYLILNTDYPEPVARTYTGAAIDVIIPHSDYLNLVDFAKKSQTSAFIVMLSAFKLLLYKSTGETDITIGSSVANRRLEEFERLIGMCVNMTILRTCISEQGTFTDIIDLVKQTVHESQHYQDIPFYELVNEIQPERMPNRNPFFGISFNFHNSIMPVINWPDVRGNLSYLSNNSSKFDITVLVIPPSGEGGQTMVRFEYSTEHYKEETIKNLVSDYLNLTKKLVATPYIPVSGISLLSETCRDTIIKSWNNTRKSYPLDKTFYQLFKEQSAITPDNICLVYNSDCLTYRELNERSNQLARHIRACFAQKTKSELKPGTLIALCPSRGLEMITGILAIMKSGGAYVPLDSNHPQERIDFFLCDTGAELILTQRRITAEKKLLLPPEKIIFIDNGEDLYRDESISDLPYYSQASDLAYVIYTSGSTGKPKGVEITHKSLNNLVLGLKETLNIDTSENVLQYSSLNFDASVFEICLALMSGSRLTITPSPIRQEAGLLCDFLRESKITLALFPSVLLGAIPYNPLPDLKTLIVGGEVTPLETMNKWSRGRRFINAYGPTECTVIATMNNYMQGDKNTNIGKPLPNVTTYVLDSNGAPVAVGVAGELFIGGAGLAKRYFNRPEQTTQRFIINPFMESGTAIEDNRLYKTGDVVRWLKDGSLEFMGRNDDQVKIRGFRIEVGEIENALSKVEGIKQCCVVAKEKMTGSGCMKYLIGYYVSEKNITPDAVIEELSGFLPEYMRPGIMVKLDIFPLTINGKLDKHALPDPEFTTYETYIPPTTKNEIEICNIWQTVLGIDKVGINDDFFAIGGNSILAIQVASKMSQYLGCKVTVSEVFRLKNIIGLLKTSKKISVNERNVNLAF